MTKIEWTDETWNPVTGCTKISPGCKNCYAERMARRLAGRYGYPEQPNHFKVTLHPDRLDQPLRWREPRMIFVNSMSDLFHEDVPFDFISKVMDVIERAPQHTFQVLTKRPAHIKQWAYWDNPQTIDLPDNLWLGVSVENQKTANERREAFRQVPAAVKFLSYEPALGPVDWIGWGFIDWLICGGESGPKARPMHPDWARAARDQCQAAGVPFFFKQWGEWKEIQFDKRGDGDILLSPTNGIVDRLPDPLDGASDFINIAAMRRVGKKAAGRLLDGREWNEMPEVCR